MAEQTYTFRQGHLLELDFQVQTLRHGAYKMGIILWISEGASQHTGTGTISP